MKARGQFQAREKFAHALRRRGELRLRRVRTVGREGHGRDYWSRRQAWQPNELMTDTAGYSDIVFGLFRLVGALYSPSHPRPQPSRQHIHRGAPSRITPPEHRGGGAVASGRQGQALPWLSASLKLPAYPSGRPGSNRRPLPWQGSVLILYSARDQKWPLNEYLPPTSTGIDADHIGSNADQTGVHADHKMGERRGTRG